MSKRNQAEKLLFKKKKKKKKDEDDVVATDVCLLFSANKDPAFYPLNFQPEKTSWDKFVEEVHQLINVSNQVNLSMQFEQKFGEKSYKTHLNKASFDVFKKYALKSAKDGTQIIFSCDVISSKTSSLTFSLHHFQNLVLENPVQVNVEYAISHLNEKILASLSSNSLKYSNMEEKIDQQISVESAIAALEEKNWDQKYISSFDKKFRQDVLRKLVKPHVEKKKCSLCPSKHMLREFTCPSVPVVNKIKSLMEIKEIRFLFTKREELELIVGNGDLLLNGLYVQCPICGSVISIGQMNKIVFLKDHLYEHVQSSHFNDTVRCSHRERCLAYLFLQRYENYFKNNKRMLLPRSIKCDEGGIHKIKAIEVPGTRISPFNTNPLTLNCPEIDNLCSIHFGNSTNENTADIDFGVNLSESSLSKPEFTSFSRKIFPHIMVTPRNMSLYIHPNVELTIPDTEDVQENGILISQQQISPNLARIQELINAGVLSPSHPFLQEINMFSMMYGNICSDPIRGFTDMKQRFPALLYLQDRMRKAATGKAAYNIYLGKHRVGCGQRLFSSENPLPNINSVFHCGLAPSSWSKKEICPALFDGPILQFIKILLKVSPYITKVKLQSETNLTLFVCLIFDQKGISPGAEVYDGAIHGIIPNLNATAVETICSNGYSAMLQSLLRHFSDGTLKWVKQIEVFMLQFLDTFVAVPVASYSLQETGDSAIIKQRIDEVLYYVNSCSNCLDESIKSGDPPECVTFCIDCFKEKKVCSRHTDLYHTWIPDNRPCEGCARLSLFCVRFKVLCTVSDMDPSYERYGKAIATSFEEQLSKQKFIVNHVHDVGHNIKNAEASLERGSHFNGKETYDGNDLAIIMSTVSHESYQQLSQGISHKAVLQFDKQSDELTLQRISSQVISTLSDAKCLLKTDVPELRRPWFAQEHGSVGKPLFVTISQFGIVFATDSYNQSVFYYRQPSLPRKISFVGTKEPNEDLTCDPNIEKQLDASKLTWKSVGGITFFRNETCVIVADIGFKSLRLLQGTKVARNQETYQPIRALKRLPNMKVMSNAMKITNNPDAVPCGLCELENGLLAVSDSVNGKLFLIEFSKSLRSCSSVIVVNLSSILKPFDCVSLTNNLIAVTDIGASPYKLHIVSINEKKVLKSLDNELYFPTCICLMDKKLLFSDCKNHCVFEYGWEDDTVELLFGKKGIPGFKDGPLDVSLVCSPYGICCRGETVYLAESPEENQGAIRVFCSLKGLIDFKTSWRKIGQCFGMYSKRERRYLLKENPEALLASMNISQLNISLTDATKDLKSLITKTREMHNVDKLDITHGSMASQTAEAIYKTMPDFAKFLCEYFSYFDQVDICNNIIAKCITTRLVECFFGHITSSIQSNNLRYLEIKRKITNEGFTFLLPHVNSLDSGVSIRSEKERVVETYSYSNDDELGPEGGSLIWHFLYLKEKSLLTVDRKRELKAKRSSGDGVRHTENKLLTFGKMTHCKDYMDLIEIQGQSQEQKLFFDEVTTALKSRPMRSLRGFCKRRFGTSPTILGTQSSRKELDNTPDIIDVIEQYAKDFTESSNNTSKNYVLSPGEFVMFRGTDNYSFNVIRLTQGYYEDDLVSTTKIIGNFLVPENVDGCLNSDHVFFYEDPLWQGGHMLYRDILRDENDSIITGKFDLVLRENREGIFYKFPFESYQQVAEISTEFEVQLKRVIENNDEDSNNLHLEDSNNLHDFEEETDNSETDEIAQPVILNRRERKSRGGNYANVIASLL